MRKVRPLVAAFCAVAFGASVVAAQESGTITGQVTDAVSRRPIVQAQLAVVGTTLGGRSGEDGRYQIVRLPAGTHQVRVIRIGYQSVTRAVTVAAGATVVADFLIQPAVTTLGEVVVTATGEEQAARSLGFAVSTVEPRQEQLAAVNSFSEMLAARTPGLVVTSAGGTVGTSSRIRIRGSNSISLSNEPLIIIDGVRVNNSESNLSFGVGGQSTSRFDDINPDDIESYNVIKGPSASALYGTAAANGVIQITTKRGQSGGALWNATIEAGGIYETNAYPANFLQVGQRSTGARVAGCGIDLQARGICTPTQDSLLSFNPLEEASPFRDGSSTGFGLSVSGGTENTTYFVSGDVDREFGVTAANQRDRVNLRANARAQVNPEFDLNVTTGYLSSELQLPFNDNTAFGVVSSGFLGSAVDDTVNRGFFFVNPRSFFGPFRRSQDIERFTGGLTANWQPRAWLRLSGQGGIDITNRFDNVLNPPNVVVVTAGLREGSRTTNRFEGAVYSGNGNAAATYNVTSDIIATSTLGVQFTDDATRGTTGFCRAILGGTSNAEGCSAGFALGEPFSKVVTIGGYGTQQFAYADRIFLNLGLRGDDNSAFGREFGFVYYPTANLSWVLSDEAFFPQAGPVDELRLRAAYGRSGQRPGFRDAETFFSPVSVRVGNVDVPAATIGGTGNVTLQPELTDEIEAGGEISFFGNRLGLNLTYYSKRTSDALVLLPLAPSLGVANGRFENIGEIQSRGLETVLSARVVDMRAVRWDADLSFTATKSEITELSVPDIIFGFGGTQRHREGLSPGAYFQRIILGFDDLNDDGLISRVNCPGQAVQVEGGPECELSLSDSLEFVGHSAPTRQAALQQTVTFFDVVRVSALLDYRGGHKLFNSTRQFRCGVFQNCREAQDINAPLADQALAATAIGSLTNEGYIEDADFVKLREVAVTLMAPAKWAGRVNASSLSLTLAGRNLATWTDYSGLDPEVNSNAAGNFTISDFLAQPPVRTFTARLSLSF